MLDAKQLRSDLDNIATQLAKRGFTLDTATITALEEQRKAIQVKTQELQNERNSRSKSIGKAKAAGEDIQPLLDEVANLGKALEAAKHSFEEVQTQLDDLYLGLPISTYNSPG